MPVEKTIEKLINSVQEDKSKETNGSASWVGALVAGISVLIITAVFGFMAWRRGKKLAKLKHEKAVQEEREHQADLDAKLSESRSERLQRALDAHLAMQQVSRLQGAIKRVRREYEEAKDVLGKITSWDDIDKYLGE